MGWRPSRRNPNLRLPRTSYLESVRPTARLQGADEPAKWGIGPAGKHCLPDARNESLRPCRVRRVFVAKLLNHHPLLRADAKRAEDRERDQVRRTSNPIRNDERLADGIQR